MITNWNYLDNIINSIQTNPLVEAYFKLKNINKISQEDKIKLIELAGYGELVEAYGFFMQVFLCRNENIYCWLDSIEGWLDYFYEMESEYNPLRGKIFSIEKEKIINRFEALAYLRAAYEIGETYFHCKKRVKRKSSVLFFYKKMKASSKGYTLESQNCLHNILLIEAIDRKIRGFLVEKGIDLTSYQHELIFSQSFSFWEVYLLHDIHAFLHLFKEHEQNKNEKLSFIKSYIIYYLISCTYIETEKGRKFYSLNFPREEQELRQEIINMNTGESYKKYIITEVKKIIDPLTRKVHITPSKK